MQTNNSNIFTVGQINKYIKGMFDSEVLLRNIVIKGEVSNITYHRSGHIYFKIKDAQSEIPAVMFASNRSGLDFQMKEGDSCLITCSINVYEVGGRYQVYARSIKKAGVGDLYRQFQELKDKLEEMGMFDKSYKKPIPEYATKIGVVTAQTGAAIRDIVQIATRRNPFVQIYLYPSLVQGDGAAESIARGIEYMDQLDMDVLIVGRGGGSIEDLWAFNEEIVARAIFNCQTPVISAVGHEIDTTIADYVSDLRAPTPSAAAELAVFDYGKLVSDLDARRLELFNLMNSKIIDNRNRINNSYNRLKIHSPEHIIQQQAMKALDLERRLEDTMKRNLESSQHRFSMLASRLDGLSPIKKFASGYSYAVGVDGNNISSTEDVNVGDDMTLYVSDGQIKTKVSEVIKEDLWQS